MVKEDNDHISIIGDIPVEIKVILGVRSMKLKELMEMKEGHIVELEREEGEPLDVLVNNRPFGRGEAIVVGEKYAIRLMEIVEDGS